MQDEVIGFLAGYSIDKQSCGDKKSRLKTLVITEVYFLDSMKPLTKNEDPFSRYEHMNVEMCPKSATAAKQLIDSRGQELIGWYHSHPFFEAKPSQIDIKNHAIYQKMFQGSNKPFIAAISAPYHNTSFKSSNWRSLN